MTRRVVPTGAEANGGDAAAVRATVRAGARADALAEAHPKARSDAAALARRVGPERRRRSASAAE